MSTGFHFASGAFFGANVIWGVLRGDVLNLVVAAALLAAFLWFRHNEKRR